jgi:hypothetical protein
MTATGPAPKLPGNGTVKRPSPTTPRNLRRGQFIWTSVSFSRDDQGFQLRHSHGPYKKPADVRQAG